MPFTNALHGTQPHGPLTEASDPAQLLSYSVTGDSRGLQETPHPRSHLPQLSQIENVFLRSQHLASGPSSDPLNKAHNLSGLVSSSIITEVSSRK